MFRTAEGPSSPPPCSAGPSAFEVDGYDPAAGAVNVIKGRAREIERMQDVFDALDLPLFPWHASPKHRFVRIAPDDVSGRRFHVVDESAWEILPRTARAPEE